MTERGITPIRTSTRGRNRRPADDLDVTDLPRLNDNASVSERESPPGVPRWVKLSGIIALVLVLAVAVLHLTGQAGGPAMHDIPTHSVILR